MKSSAPSNVAASPVGVAARPAHRAGDGKRAMIKITHTVTSDSADGQPWPPTERNVLWSLLRQADDCSHWRAIELAESDPLPRTSAISLGSDAK